MQCLLPGRGCRIYLDLERGECAQWRRREVRESSASVAVNRTDRSNVIMNLLLLLETLGLSLMGNGRVLHMLDGKWGEPRKVKGMPARVVAVTVINPYQAFVVWRAWHKSFDRMCVFDMGTSLSTATACW
jgi:hypothetical protein